MKIVIKIWLLALLAGIVTFTYIGHALGSTDKYDGDCTGHETVGRCADKCPEGYFERGFDKETGAAICGHVTGCPYGDSIPLGPQCDKQAPQQPAATTETAPVEYVPTENVMSGGK